MRAARYLGFFACGFFAAASLAHEARPGYLQLTQATPTSFEVLLKIPAVGNMRLSLSPRLPEHCTLIAPAVTHIVEGAYLERVTLSCATSLTGETIRIDGLSSTLTDVLVRFERMDGTVQVSRLTPAAPSFVVEESPSALEVATTYLTIGVEHILFGVDHLLFVLALLLVVRGWRRLVATLTAFTVAHSVTLAAATLGLVNVPQQPVEAVIALSIVFVAGEIVHISQGRTSMTRRWPWIVAFVFGLLHGLGFAGALSQVGLPEQSIPLALLLFNLGVELGQLLFIGAIAAAAFLLRATEFRWPLWTKALPAYGIGTVAVFWVVERTAGFWS
ncbi:MAG: HupE/UreJ family protein [Gammaproteobacteria bacterium]|nr:HupE/UreJ family protein [Gammaproteobacteria bacterium]